MPTTDDFRQERLAELEAAVLAHAAERDEPPASAEELTELSARAHQSLLNGTFMQRRTELRVRLHGDGVSGHLVPSDQAGSLLKRTQLLVRWIGARLRSTEDVNPIGNGKDVGIVDATRLFLTPQFGAGSLVFDLVASEPRPDEQPPLDGLPAPASVLDRSLEQLLGIIASSETDSGQDLGELSAYVSRMGPRVASQLKALAEEVTDNQIDLDLRWTGTDGRRRRADLGRRGALAIKDAVERNRVKINEMTLAGLLETASTGKDHVRIDTATGSYKMAVDPELGVTLGRWLHQEVVARVEQTITWHNSGKETKRYKLLAISAPEELP